MPSLCIEIQMRKTDVGWNRMYQIQVTFFGTIKAAEHFYLFNFEQCFDELYILKHLSARQKLE